jgi:ADP-ribose pyrophosphatase
MRQFNFLHLYPIARIGNSNVLVDQPMFKMILILAWDCDDFNRIHPNVRKEKSAMRARRNHARKVHSGRVFELHVDNVTLENGVTVDMDVIRHPGAAAIVPLTARGGVLLIRQFRYAIGADIWEIPAGTLNPGESPLICARRELEEEVGILAAKWSALGTITPLPGYSDEVIHLFVAREHTPGCQQLDADEMLEVREVPFEEALAMISAGAIRDAKTIAAILLAAGATAR